MVLHNRGLSPYLSHCAFRLNPVTFFHLPAGFTQSKEPTASLSRRVRVQPGKPVSNPVLPLRIKPSRTKYITTLQTSKVEHCFRWDQWRGRGLAWARQNKSKHLAALGYQRRSDLFSPTVVLDVELHTERG